MVFFSVPVMRSMARTALPSHSRWRHSSARSSGRVMAPRGRTGRSENVLRQVRHWYRWCPSRVFPHFLQLSVWQAWHSMAVTSSGRCQPCHNGNAGPFGFDWRIQAPAVATNDYRGRLLLRF